MTVTSPFSAYCASFWRSLLHAKMPNHARSHSQTCLLWVFRPMRVLQLPDKPRLQKWDTRQGLSTIVELNRRSLTLIFIALVLPPQFLFSSIFCKEKDGNKIHLYYQQMYTYKNTSLFLLETGLYFILKLSILSLPFLYTGTQIHFRTHI